MIPWEKLGANIVAALENGEQVIKLLHENPNIDLMILDIRMPVMDGLSVAKHVREQGYEAEIVLLSAHAEFSYACDALKYDIREYFLKPISRTKLNKLCEVIQSVSEEKDTNIRWRLYLRDKALQEEVKNILRRQDMQALDSLLDTESKFGQISVKKLKEYGSVLLGMLWDYCKPFVQDKDLFETHMKTFYEISDAKAMKNFLKEKFSEGMKMDNSDAKKTGVNIVALAKKYIDDNIIGHGLNSYSVASSFNLSVDYLSRVFKIAGEDSLSDYIIQAKMDKAKEIISTSAFSIRQVAEMLGYTDTSYFIRMFKKKFGITPNEFRTKYRKGED